MAAKLHGGAFHALGRQRGEMLADRDRAGEGNLAHRVLAKQIFGDFRRHAEHQIENTRGQPGINEAAHHLDAGAGRFFRRLEDERAAGRKRAADFPRRRQHREIPRCECRNDADRLLQHELADALAAARDDSAVRAAAFFGVPVDDVGRRDHLGAGLRIGLALLQHHDLGDRVETLAHQVGGLVQNLATVIGRRGPPHRKTFAGRFECRIEIGFARVRQPGQRLLRRRIEHVLAFATRGRHCHLPPMNNSRLPYMTSSLGFWFAVVGEGLAGFPVSFIPPGCGLPVSGAASRNSFDHLVGNSQ